ncbi:MAG: T9SS type A sorting domain-containing protein [Bacteroidales bacterium]|nr:T9SS type A sorting domain-containing protein [Bacteroidales bacterium]
MKKLFILFTMVLSCVVGFAQIVTLTFTGRDADNHFLPFNRVLIVNVTQGWQETIYYPDTILILGGTGIEENASAKGFVLSQNNPNPFDGTTNATLTTSETGEVQMEMLDMNGHMVAAQKFGDIQTGVHQFILTVATPGTYILTARQNGRISSIKMVNNGKGPTNRIEYAGVSGMKIGKSQQGTGSKGSTGNPFNLGDEMMYIGFANVNGTEHTSQTIHNQHQIVSENFILNFNITASSGGQPCPDMPTVIDYDGNMYNTVQIGQQCWMKENLRVKHYSDGTPIPAGGDTNSYAEPYYYDYSSSGIPLVERGYHYNWPAAMHGAASSNAVPSGVQGVCPTGWHLPSDAEWTVLTDYVSANYACGGDSWNNAKALASTTWWESCSGECLPGDQSVTANNASGFGAVPAGSWPPYWYFVGLHAVFWSSTEIEGESWRAYGRLLGSSYASVVAWVDTNSIDLGFSVRCIRDDSGGGSTATLPTVTTNAVSGITDTSAICGGYVTSDGGANVTARGVCWSTSPNPTVNNNHSADGGGTGSFTSSITGLTADTTYYVRAYATNSAGTAYGDEVSFTIPVIDEKSCPEAPTVTDHEGNVYATVKIGNQCWTRDNLRTTTSPSTGTYLIPASGTGKTFTGKQARWYNNDSATYAPLNYGLLYNWNAAVDTFNTAYGETSVNTSYNNAVSVTFNGHRRGICPAGWHLPSDAEWTAMTDYVSGQSEYVCGGNTSNIAKALADSVGWYSSTYTCTVGNNQSANNASGFSAVPAGYCVGLGFVYAGSYAFFWSSSQYEGYPRNAAYRSLEYGFGYVDRYTNYKYCGQSVRCLRD